MIRFTRHAREKFYILKRHKVKITEKAVRQAIEKPELIDESRLPLHIAQIDFDKDHVLRVVYKTENKDKIVITFYPGRKKQYVKQ